MKNIEPLSKEAEAEIVRFTKEIHKLESGASDPDDFRRFRLENGVYGIRGTADRHMVRIKILLGKLTPGQLETIAASDVRYDKKPQAVELLLRIA